MLMPPRGGREREREKDREGEREKNLFQIIFIVETL